MAKVVGVVPLYINHPSLYGIVDRFFESLREYYPELPLIVVDDCSPLNHDFPTHLVNDENKGFTATVNKGLALAFQNEADVVIVMNDDLQIKDGDLDGFYAMDGAMIASPMDTSASNDDRWGAIWGITRAAYEKLGPLNEAYKHYFSDRDYYDRAKEAGITIEKWYDCVVDHPESATYKHVAKDELLEKDKEAYFGTSSSDS